MNNSNLPDDCQSLTDQNLPWNQDDDIFMCWHCEETVNEEEIQEIKTKRNGYQFICDDCIDEYKEGI